MILLSLADVTKHYGPEPVLEGVGLELRPGEKVGLVGPNGAGKSTLMKIVAGMIEPDRGSVDLHSSVRVGYLEQHPTFTDDVTLWQAAQQGLAELLDLAQQAERVAAQLAAAATDDDRARLGRLFDRLQYQLQHHDAYNVEYRVERVLEGLGFSSAMYDQATSTLSGGQQNRLLLAQLLLREPDLLLLDEPSNHLDIEATEWLESYLVASSQAMLIVSHDRYLLDKVTGRTLELVRGHVEDYQGNFSAYWRQREERNLVLQRTYERQQQQIAKTEEFIRRNHYGQKSTQAEDRRKKLARIERVAPPRTITAPAFAFPPATRTGDVVLRAEGLAKAFDRPLFSHVTFQVERGTRWGILGPNGIGKTTLLRCLVGDLEPDGGTVSLGTGVRIGYYDQHLGALDPSAAVVEAIRPPHKQFDEPQRRSLLARFGLQGEAVFQTVGSLSGGERSRAALAYLSALDANVLVLDEPTNHLDLWACDALERALADFDGTVIFVSHDRYFLNRVADHVLAVEPARVRVIEGNYEAYLHFVRRDRAAETARSAPAGHDASSRNKGNAATGTRDASAASPASPAARRKRKFPYRKLEELEREIFQLEERIGALHAAMLEPEALRDGRRVKQLQDEVAQQQGALAQLYEHWEEASELNQLKTRHGQPGYFVLYSLPRRVAPAPAAGHRPGP